jgi:hypothetical protein
MLLWPDSGRKDMALESVNRSPLRNVTAIFTGSGKFFGDLHAHGKDAVGFYTEQKVIMSRWF